MGAFPRALAAIAVLVAASAAAAAQPLKPEWSRPVGGKTRFVGVEEYGRCSVFVDNGALQVVAPSGDVMWTWPFRQISSYINPREVAVSHACDAMAFVGNASYKYVWIVDRAGASASIKVSETPADVEFDRDGRFVAVGTYVGSISLYSVNGQPQWTRRVNASIVQGLEFSDDNQRIVFDSWAGGGTVTMAGHVESSSRRSDDSGQEHRPRTIAISDDGTRRWLRGDEAIECVNERGEVLGTIDASPDFRRVNVSRDFGQVLVVTEKDLRPVSVERYAVPAPCRP